MKIVGALAAVGALGAGLYFTLRKGGGGELSGTRTRFRGPHEVRELKLTCENDGDLYRQQVQPIHKNLEKRLAKGTYDHEKAKKLWMYLADNCARKYVKQYGDESGLPWNKLFSVADRREVAKQFADEFLNEHEIQNRHPHTPGGRSR